MGLMVEHSVENANQPAQGASLGLATNKIPTYKKHITEKTIATAAGLMKDWTTALIQLQTAALGVIGALVGYADFSKFALPSGQVLIVAAAAVAFAISLFCGVLLLNLLPGCVQRLPADDDTFKLDIYSMYTIDGGRDVGFWSNGLRRCFVAGIFLLALFIVCRFATYAFPNLHASMRWLF